MDISTIYWTNHYNDVKLEDYTTYRRMAKDLLYLTAIRKYRSEKLGIDLLNDEDIIANATAALVRADVTHDPDRGSLKTHRINHIKWYLATYFRNRDSQIKNKPCYHFSHRDDDMFAFQNLPSHTNQIDEVCNNEMQKMVQEAIKTSNLTRTERKYLTKYYNINSNTHHTYSSLGKENNHSTERSRQIIVDAKKRLKKHIERKYPALVANVV